MTKTVLFLDIDGPCHPADAASALPSRCVAGEDLFRWVGPLLRLLEKMPHVDVVVHSSWRHVYRDLPSLLADLPRALASRVVDVAPVEIADRQLAIEEYVKRHDVQRFAVVDDTPMQFDKDLPWLVVTGPEGLSDPQAIRALQQALEVPVGRQKS